MATFNSTYGAESMMASIAWIIGKDIESDQSIDIHTITLLLSGQSGEFDLTIEATDADMENRKWEGTAHRYGGVSGLKEVEVR